MKAEIRHADYNDLEAISAIETNNQDYPFSSYQLKSCFSESYINLVVAVNNSVVGFILCYKNYDFWEIHNICIARHARGNALGKLLILEVINLMRRDGIGKLLLEVRESNCVALSLYKKLGFVEVARRNNYYPVGDNSFEDAILMNLDVTVSL